MKSRDDLIYIVSCGIIITSALGIFGCSTKDQVLADQVTGGTKVTQDTTHVYATGLSLNSFVREILSQGKIQSSEKVDISFPADGIIKELKVHRGQRVSVGQILANLDTVKWRQEYELLEAEMDEIKLQLELRLLSLGYDEKHQPPETMREKIEIELGIRTLQKRIAHKSTELSEKEIKAPISGIVAELEAQAGNPTSNYKNLCTIVNDRRLEVKFPLLESEIAMISKGMAVEVTPFHGENASKAKVTSYSPMVDKDGLIWVYAEILKNEGQLLDGMKVSVIVQESVPGQRILPKSAVLDRQDRYVIFVYRKGVAHWVYGHIDQENSTHYTLKDDGPQPGDTVIISNNFNLAHLEPVVIDSLITTP